ncbi:hypothetical protein NDU88_002265 [Pleurodeles waltl]|uniref:Uncharacterized protein n=1 Tax=Pleurodeles waltl TaxID=8319 RepID=A0AAV7SBE8_PLEWA|nr:hypothetical protein NDU88_002265 [Pleurodeles waltl]
MPPQARRCVIACVTTRSGAREPEEEAHIVNSSHWRRVALVVRRVRTLTSRVALRGATRGDLGRGSTGRELLHEDHQNTKAVNAQRRGVLLTTSASKYQGLEDLRMKKLGDTDKIPVEDEIRVGEITQVISKGKKGKSAGPDD